MKIERLRVHALGGLRGFDTGPQPLGSLVVLLGTNEAGKTTVMEAIRALLYGFYPARRETHPLTPWEGDAAAEVEGWVCTAQGVRAHVHRRLVAQPTGMVETLPSEGWEPEKGQEEPLPIRNGDLPGAAGVQRGVYIQTHTLTLPELAHFGASKPWLAIRDRILAGMGTGDMVAPRVLAATLESEGRQLWRPDRRGSSVHSELERARRLAEERLGHARAEAQARRQAAAELALLRIELSRAQAERAHLQERLNEARERGALAARSRLEAEAAAHEEALYRLPLEAVQGALSELDGARDAQTTADALVAEQNRRLPPVPPRGSPPSTFRVLFGLGGLVAGTALFLLVTGGGGSGDLPALVALLGGSAMAGVALWIRREQARALEAHTIVLKEFTAAQESARVAAEGARVRVAQARKELEQLLAGLPLRERVVDEPHEGLDRDLLLVAARLRELRHAEGRSVRTPVRAPDSEDGGVPHHEAPAADAQALEAAQAFEAAEALDGARVLEATKALDAAQERVETLREDLRLLEATVQRATTASPDVIQGEILALEADMTRVLRNRDRLRILQALILRGEERFRNREQPALLREAGALLHALTGARYDGLSLQPGGDEALTVRGTHLPEPMPVGEPLSTGTREQIWFALRMAALRGVEDGSPPLPIILDEILVNWDADRRRAALSTLAHLSDARQIFFLTCHPGIAAEAEAAGAQILRLPTLPQGAGR